MIRKSITALVLLLVLYVIFLRPEDPFKNTDMPQELVGVWITDSPRYAERSLKLEKMFVTFDQEDTGTTVHPIKKLMRRVDGDREFYVLVYKQNNEPEQTLRFEYNRSDGGTILISNQKDVVWTRQGPQ